MTERDALLRGVLDDPGDDTVRLVYADWLQENGDPDTARFIRTCIADPTVPPPLAEHFGYDGAARLGLPDGFFVTNMSIKAVAGAAVASCLGMGVVGRGFVGEVHLSDEIFFASAERLFRAHPITRVVVTSGMPIYPSGGNDWFFVGGLGRFPIHYWRRLDSHPTRRNAEVARSRVCVDYGRELAGLKPLYATKPEVPV